MPSNEITKNQYFCGEPEEIIPHSTCRRKIVWKEFTAITVESRLANEVINLLVTSNDPLPNHIKNVRRETSKTCSIIVSSGNLDKVAVLVPITQPYNVEQAREFSKFWPCRYNLQKFIPKPFPRLELIQSFILNSNRVKKNTCSSYALVFGPYPSKKLLFEGYQGESMIDHPVMNILIQSGKERRRGKHNLYCLTGCTVFLSHVPCTMCSMALVLARIESLVIGLPPQCKPNLLDLDIPTSTILTHRYRVYAAKTVDGFCPVKQYYDSTIMTGIDNQGVNQPVISSANTESLKSNRYETFKKRFLATLTLTSFFAGVVFAGPFWCSVLVLLITMGIYHEINRLQQNIHEELGLQGMGALRWYFFFVTVYYASCRLLPYHVVHLTKNNPLIFNALVKKANFTAYLGLICGIIAFVLTLRSEKIMYQFRQLAWIILPLVTVVLQGICQIANIYDGLYWFLYPAALVIVNDVMAYVFGSLFGKTPLIMLSPKKTKEGFIGATIFTVLTGILLSGILLRYPYFTCRWMTLSVNCFKIDTSFCEVPHHFRTTTNIKTLFGNDELKDVSLPADVSLSSSASLLNLLRDLRVLLPNVEIPTIFIHSVVLSLFASLIAPFGGFFASGFKRAFKIKDFGSSIPGHGGITDRFDCQVLMGAFTYVYIRTFVHGSTNIVDSLIRQYSILNREEKMLFLAKLNII